MMSQEASGRRITVVRGGGLGDGQSARRPVGAMQCAVPRAWRLPQERRLPIMITFC